MWKAWRFYFSIYKRKARLAAYTRNTLYRKKLVRLFTSWRRVTDMEFKERLNREKSTFRNDLESKILVQWSTKVDALTLYVAELEDKIKHEQEAREKLKIAYDQSLNLGHQRLVDETALLTQNPLIHEVSYPACVQEDKRLTIEMRRQSIYARMQEHLASRGMSDNSQNSNAASNGVPSVGGSRRGVGSGSKEENQLVSETQ